MNVGSTKENNLEKRISITPETSKSFKNLGLNVFLEKGYGESLGYKDQEYKDKGVQILNDPKEVLSKLNLICQVKLPIEEEFKNIKDNSNLILSNYNYEQIYPKLYVCCNTRYDICSVYLFFHF